MSILGIDYGEKRIGFAVSDEFNSIALPLKQIENKGHQDLVKEIKQVSDAYKIKEIVLGLPLTLEGQERSLSEKIRRLAILLEKEISLKVHFVDERFSSKEVSSDLIKRADLSRGKRKKVLDKLAATKILQTFLDIRRSVS
ncbi:MAG: Holliday junction resolvase RuvX [Alphaproteobacteria bacterium]|nr:Holliday junction resolvase RuvX [Alphaproteobacteria bacterium]